MFISAELEPKDHIVTAIGKAYHWRELLIQESLTIAPLASRFGFSESQIRKYMPLINLSPDILKRSLTGHLPPTVTLMNLLAAAQHPNWEQQGHFLGLDQIRTSHLTQTKSS